jgi:hypothetical protein
VSREATVGVFFELADRLLCHVRLASTSSSVRFDTTDFGATSVISILSFAN